MRDSPIVLYGAIAANVAIAVTKFVVAGITGSSAMLSEGIHSLVDTGNGGLLLVGEHRSRRPASPEHPFGHGKELFFWSLIVGVLIFGVGGGVSLYEGVLHVREPRPIEDAGWNYVVLGCAAVFESISLTIAWRQFSRERAGEPFWQALHASKNPSTYTVLAEDAAALLGLAIAAAGVVASHEFGMPRADGFASIAIGLMLCAVAVLLIRESRGLLVGEGIGRDTARAIRDTALREDAVSDVGPILSMYVGPEDVLVTFDARFRDGMPSEQVAAGIGRIEAQVRARFPRVRRIYIEPAVAKGP